MQRAAPGEKGRLRVRELSTARGLRDAPIIRDNAENRKGVSG